MYRVCVLCIISSLTYTHPTLTPKLSTQQYLSKDYISLVLTPPSIVNRRIILAEGVALEFITKPRIIQPHFYDNQDGTFPNCNKNTHKPPSCDLTPGAICTIIIRIGIPKMIMKFFFIVLIPVIARYKAAVYKLYVNLV